MTTTPLKTAGSRPASRSDFHIAIICALGTESDAIEALFDEFWDDDLGYGKAAGDQNAYTFGRILSHNVVLAYMPGIGKTASATAAASLRASFPNVRLGLVAGVCGGAPWDEKLNEIVLGDVIVSTGIVQHDFSRQFENYTVRKTSVQDNFGRPSHEVRAFLHKLQAMRGRKELLRSMTRFMEQICSREDFSTVSYPGTTKDRLFASSYLHKHRSNNMCAVCEGLNSSGDIICTDAMQATCEELCCDEDSLLPRTRLATHEQLASGQTPDLTTYQPLIHFGQFATGDLVIRSAYHRDQLVRTDHVIGFEMEGAGAWDSFPTIIVKGVCDYADSHKNKVFQSYAAITAAACCKAMLQQRPNWEIGLTDTNGGVINPTRSTDDLIQRIRGEVSISNSLRETTIAQSHSLLQNVEVSTPDNAQTRTLQQTIPLNAPYLHQSKQNLIKPLAHDLIQVAHLKISINQYLGKPSEEGHDHNFIIRQVNSISECLSRINAEVGRVERSNKLRHEEKEPFNIRFASFLKQMSQFISDIRGSSEIAISEPSPHQRLSPETKGDFHREFSKPSHPIKSLGRAWTKLMRIVDELRSTASACIVISLKDLYMHSSGTNLDEDLETLLRVFQNDIETVDSLVRVHNDVVRHFIQTSTMTQAEHSPNGHRDFISLFTSSSNSVAKPSFGPEDVRCQLNRAITQAEQQKRDVILESLVFRHMVTREYEVSDAYPETFDWIFRQTVAQRPWDDFPTFLRAKNICKPYWLAGKAGSGKSTLMKFLAKDQRTMDYLRIWSDGKDILVLKFFFWNLGTEMQKSQHGLLLTMLWQIFKRYPDLIRIVFEDTWPLINPNMGTNWRFSSQEAKKALEKLFTEIHRPFYCCIFVDGLDEYEGDHIDLAVFLRSLSGPDVKVVASSRPIPACIDKFAGCPSLRLEYLTYNDICTYVDGELEQHNYMLEIMQAEPEEAQQLITEVSDKASGVFLWVTLVVKSLLQGLRNGDNIADLHDRLKELPPDLENLFQHMLDHLDPSYREQAMQYFEIFRETSSICDQSFTVLDMYYAQAKPQDCMKSAVLTLKNDHARAVQKCGMLERRIRSRCCGLLELHSTIMEERNQQWMLTRNRRVRKVTDEPDSELLGAHVQYLHRSVAEFLYQPHVWSKIAHRKVEDGFDFHRALFHAYAAKLHRRHSNPQFSQPGSEETNTLMKALLFCDRQYKTNSGSLRNDILEELIPYADRADERSIRIILKEWNRPGVSSCKNKTPRSVSPDSEDLADSSATETEETYRKSPFRRKRMSTHDPTSQPNI